VALNSRQLLIIIAAVVIVAAGGVYWYVSRTEPVVLASTSGGEAPAATPASQEGSDLMVAGPLGEMGLGDPKAPNVIIEYASMTCPHCQAWHAQVYKDFKAKYIDTGKVYFIFREYPLDPLATAAIMIARCAPPERYFPLVDLMFENQKQWAFVSDPSTALQNLVKQAGVTPEAFKACLTNQQILDGVNWVKNRATNEFDVNSTPTFFINGQMHKGEQTLEAFDSVLGG
jgi:protein-disulfide isomerase